MLVSASSIIGEPVGELYLDLVEVLEGFPLDPWVSYEPILAFHRKEYGPEDGLIRSAHGSSKETDNPGAYSSIPLASVQVSF